jgi:hypothetical protein
MRSSAQCRSTALQRVGHARQPLRRQLHSLGLALRHHGEAHRCGNADQGRAAHAERPDGLDDLLDGREVEIDLIVGESGLVENTDRPVGPSDGGDG